MRIRRFVSKIFAANTYLIESNGHSIIIDPAIDVIDKCIENCGTVDFVLLTHEHYDHISGVEIVKEKTSCKVLCGVKAVEGLQNSKVNLSRYLEQLSGFIPFGTNDVQLYNCDFYCTPDDVIKDNQLIMWQNHKIMGKDTPGHSKGSVSFLVNDIYLFCGDTLFEKYAVQTGLPGGSCKSYDLVTKPWINTLDSETVVFPGHLAEFKLGSALDLL